MRGVDNKNEIPKPKLRKLKLQPNTVSKGFRSDVIEIQPCHLRALYLNGIEASISNVSYAFERVDLSFAKKRVYLVEHAIGLCAMYGIHSAVISGQETEWDLSRPSHRKAKKEGHLPKDVLGEGSGRISDTICDIDIRDPINGGDIEFTVIDDQISYSSPTGTKIHLLPPSNPETLSALSVSCSYKNLKVELIMDLRTGISNKDLRASLLKARSIAVIGNWTKEAVTHAVGDIIADIVWLGRIAADIKVDLGLGYHQATAEIVRRVLAVE